MIEGMNLVMTAPYLRELLPLDSRSPKRSRLAPVKRALRAALRLLPVLLPGLVMSFSLGAISISAQADTTLDGVIYDATGLPRCIPAQDGRDALVFFWDEEAPYQKVIHAAAMSQMQFFVQNGDGSPYTCANFNTYLYGVDHTGGYVSESWTVLPGAGQKGYQSGGKTYNWSQTIEKGLNLVRLGASVAHPGDNAAQFLARYPIADFTRDYNRKITASYGVGFAADIYKEWLLNQPGNRELLAKIELEIRHVQTQGSTEVSRKLKNYKILIAQGYMQSPTQNRLAPLIKRLESLGADVSVMSDDTVGPILPNMLSFKSQISRELSNGRQLILIAASKGAPEILTAIGQIATEDPRYLKQITAVITMAGMIEGSFLVDWADRFPINMFVKDALKTGSEESRLPLTSTAGFFDMSTESLAKQSLLYRQRLPNLHYYNFVGVITGDGIAKDPDIKMLQQKISIPHASAHGGNDGYIEYPGTRFPRSWGLRSRDVVFDSSHAILDGALNGHSMQTERDSVIDGLFSAVLSDAVTK